MDYETATQVFFQPSPPQAPIPYPVAEGSPARRLRDGCEPIAMHAIWSRLTNERLAALGLNFLTSYVWGRAAALGEPPASVVVATFAAFESGLVTALYDEGRQKANRTQMLAAREEATIASLQQILEEVTNNEELTFAVTTLRRGLEAADATGRPLFAGLQAQKWPDSLYGQLWRACDLVREHRGDSHIAAYISAGFGPVAMNILTELYVGMPLTSYTATRGWSAETMAATVKQLEAAGLLGESGLTPDGQKLRHSIEERTDAMEQPLIEAIGTDLDKLLGLLNNWSAKCIEAKAFPPDQYKRAAG